jgi:hypothetical protein
MLEDMCNACVVDWRCTESHVKNVMRVVCREVEPSRIGPMHELNGRQIELGNRGYRNDAKITA